MDRRRWTPTETWKLVNLVKENYDFLFGAINPSKTRQMIDLKWKKIADSINSMGSGKVPLTVDQVSKKWTDLKSSTKLVVMKYKKGQIQTGGGINTAKEPTELQWAISTIIGSQATQGIKGTALCDSSIPDASRKALVAAQGHLPSSPSRSSVAVLTEAAPCPQTPIHNYIARDSEGTTAPTAFLTKRRKTPKQQQLDQNRELLKTESELMDAVGGIRDELQQTNSILSGILFEMKRKNDLADSTVSELPAMYYNN